MKVTAVVPSAGRGKRIKSRIQKPYLNLGGKPVLAHTLEALNSSSSIDDIIVAVDKNAITKAKKIIDRYKIRKVTAVVQGGRRRSESVYNCLKLVDTGCDYVVIHDGARPFIDEGTIKRALNAAKKGGASVAGVPLVPTIKVVDKNLNVVSTPPRHRFWITQTPQVFKRDLILKAYRSFGARKMDPTDDSTLVESMGVKVKMVMGSYRNIKITTPEDIKLAKALL